MHILPLTRTFLGNDLLPGPARVARCCKTQEDGAAVPSFRVAMLAQGLSLDSTLVAESQGSLSVKVTGMYLNPNSLMSG